MTTVVDSKRHVIRLAALALALALAGACTDSTADQRQADQTTEGETAATVSPDDADGVADDTVDGASDDGAASDQPSATADDEIVLVEEGLASEEQAQPPELDTRPDDVDIEADGTFDDEGTLSDLDPGSALACAALEIGRDALVDGTTDVAGDLARRVVDRVDDIGDPEIAELVTGLAEGEDGTIDELERGVQQCETLGYEVA